MIAELKIESWTVELDCLIDDLLTSTGFSAPPVDALKVAAELNLDVLWDSRQRPRARFVDKSAQKSGKGGSIFLRPEPREERRQWAVAHEIGEWLCETAAGRVETGELSTPGAREWTASLLASRLLLPTAWFLTDAWAMDWDLAALKSRYCTASHELIARRMLDFEVPAIMTIFDNGHLVFRRASLGGGVPGVSPAERACQSLVHQTGQPQMHRFDEGWVRGWPVCESNWKREILRTEAEID
jgi:hypothetical protein